jgi:hypothetical protein
MTRAERLPWPPAATRISLSLQEKRIRSSSGMEGAMLMLESSGYSVMFPPSGAIKRG